ncbi:hypothetical protein CYMTET_35131, partial [Cymbomonas tetramitiformis]
EEGLSIAPQEGLSIAPQEQGLSIAPQEEGLSIAPQQGLSIRAEGRAAGHNASLRARAAAERVFREKLMRKRQSPTVETQPSGGGSTEWPARCRGSTHGSVNVGFVKALGLGMLGGVCMGLGMLGECMGLGMLGVCMGAGMLGPNKVDLGGPDLHD